MDILTGRFAAADGPATADVVAGKSGAKSEALHEQLPAWRRRVAVVDGVFSSFGVPKAIAKEVE